MVIDIKGVKSYVPDSAIVAGKIDMTQAVPLAVHELAQKKIEIQVEIDTLTLATSDVQCIAWARGNWSECQRIDELKYKLANL